jgi:sensor domain CHASE-containing protein
MASPTCLLRNDKPLVVKHSPRQIRTFTASAIAHNIHTSLDHADGHRGAVPVPVLGGGPTAASSAPITPTRSHSSVIAARPAFAVSDRSGAPARTR